MAALGARLGSALGFTLSSALLGRRLDPDAFGASVVLLSIATAASILGSAGANRALLRDVAVALARGEPWRIRDLLSASARLFAISIPIGSLVGLCTAVIVTGTSSRVSLLLATGIAAVLCLNLIGSDLLRGLGEIVVSNLIAGRNGGALTMVLFTIALVAADVDTLDGALAAFLVAVVLSTAVAAVRTVQLVLSMHARPPEPAQPASPTARALLAMSWVFGATQLALFAAAQSDLWVAGAVLAPDESGAYGAALRLMTIVILPLQAAQLSMVNRIAALHATTDRVVLEQAVRRAAALSGLPALVMLVPCLVAPTLLLDVLFGPGYASAAFALQLLALAQAVNAWSGLCGVALSMTGNERTVLVAATVGGFATATAGYVGARVAGLDGLAIGSALSTAGMYVALWWLARRRIGIWTHADPRLLKGYLHRS